MMFGRLVRSWTVRASFAGAMAASTLAVAAPSAGAAEATPASATTPLSVTAESFRFLNVPVFLRAGNSSVTFRNISADDDHEFVALNLGPSCSRSVATVDDAKALLMSVGQQANQAGADDPEPYFEAACPGGSFEGAAFAPPGGTDTEDFAFTPGRTLYLCGVPEDGVPHFELGMIGFINVIDPATRAGMPTGLELVAALRQPSGLRDLTTALLPAGVSLPSGFVFPNISGLLSGLNLPAGVRLPAGFGQLAGA